MPGPAPKPNRRRRNVPARGEWQPAPDATGWQHGEIPRPPSGLEDASIEAWDTWFKAWFASYWTPDDLPGLRQLIRLYDQVERNEFQRAAELRMEMDGYGITPRGQLVLRWTRPTGEEAPKSQSQNRQSGGRYAHLTVLGEEQPA